MIAHPPCTYLCNSGVRWLYNKKTGINYARKSLMDDAGIFFQKLLYSGINRICVENPIPHKYAKMYTGQYDQTIQPWQFGHGETKATCLWLRNLPKLVPTNIVSGREAKVHKCSPGPDRWKIRSKTLSGIGNAMATQWGKLI